MDPKRPWECADMGQVRAEIDRIDGELVGHGAMRGKPGPVYGRLHEAYQRAKATMSL